MDHSKLLLRLLKLGASYRFLQNLVKSSRGQLYSTLVSLLNEAHLDRDTMKIFGIETIADLCLLSDASVSVENIDLPLLVVEVSKIGIPSWFDSIFSSIVHVKK